MNQHGPRRLPAGTEPTKGSAFVGSKGKGQSTKPEGTGRQQEHGRCVALGVQGELPWGQAAGGARSLQFCTISPKYRVDETWRGRKESCRGWR